MTLVTSLTSFALTGCAAALFIVVTLSTPINRSLSLFHINGDNVTADMGIFGGCYHVVTSTICPRAALGYIPASEHLTASSNGAWGWFHRLSMALVLNPIAAGVGVLACGAFLLATCFPRSPLLMSSFVLLTFATILAFAALGINLAITLIVRSKVNVLTEGAYTASIGTSLWLSVGGVGAFLLALFFTINTFGRGGKVRHAEDENQWHRRAKYRGTY